MNMPQGRASAPEMGREVKARAAMGRPAMLPRTHMQLTPQPSATIFKDSRQARTAAWR